MVAPESKTTAKENSCLREDRPRIHVIFPRKTRTAGSAARPPLRDDARGAQVEINSADPGPLPILADGARVKLIDKIKRAINSGQSSQTAEPRTLNPSELHRLYAGTPVPEHRYLSLSLTEAVNSPEIAPHPARWLAGVSGIDLSKVVDAWLNTNRSTEYEQLYCIGLDPDTNQLTGVVKVKKGGGYSGGPCTSGSTEHVAFWVDWGWGFQYEGTASATVYDFGWLPPAGLEYNLSLPVGHFSRLQSRGEEATTVKVRAVLSWNTPPSTTDPNAPVVWGNTMEIRIPIPPRHTADPGNQAPSLRTDDAKEISPDGRVVNAAIQALAGMAFGPDAALTVAPESAVGNAGRSDRSFAINARDIEDGSCAFTLYVSKRNTVNRGASSNLENTPVEASSQEKKLLNRLASPKADGFRFSKRAPSAATQEREGIE